ncbi:hypothetical protein ACM66B_006384 [Microbotryomycetes sp. NB124-2]
MQNGHALAGAASEHPLSDPNLPLAVGNNSNSLEDNLRQLAVLQALVARQQALVRSAAQANGHSQIVLPVVEPAGLGSLEGFHNLAQQQPLAAGSSNSVAHPQESRDQQPRPTARDSLNWLPSGSTAEFAQAQQQLNNWSQTIFRTADSPYNTAHEQHPPTTPMPTPASPESSNFEWPALYASAQPAALFNTPSSLAPSLTLNQVNSYNGSVDNAAPAPTATGHRPGLMQSVSHDTGSGLRDYVVKSDEPPDPVSRSRRASRAASVSSGSHANSTADNSPKQPGKASDLSAVRDPSLPPDQLFDSLNELRPAPLKYGTPEQIEEDKRMRNTLASARFRAKKKMKDQQLLQSSLSLREKVAELESERASLVAENTWLKELVSDQQRGDSASKTQKKKR